MDILSTQTIFFRFKQFFAPASFCNNFFCPSDCCGFHYKFIYIYIYIYSIVRSINLICKQTFNRVFWVYWSGPFLRIFP